MADIQHYNPELVVMKNPIITSKLNFSPLQVQLMLEMVAKIHPADENFNEVRINVKELAEKLNMDNGQIYENIEKATKGMNTWIRIKENDGSDYTDLVLLTKVKYWKKKGYVEMKFHEDLKPYLLQIKESSFFSYHIEATRHLKSYSFIKLYWLLVAWKSVKTKIFMLDSLKETLELTGQYPQYFDFKKRVLQPARAAFIKYGEIYFDYEEIRENPKSQRSAIEKIKFSILPNPNWKKRKSLNFADIEPVQPDTSTPEIQELLKGILSLSKDITEAEAMQFIRNHTIYKQKDILSEIIAIKKKKIKGKEIIDHLATLANAVAKQYSKGLFEEQEQKRKEQEEQKLIDSWDREFETRFKAYKIERADTAEPHEIDSFRETYPHSFYRGEPIKEHLGFFVAVNRGEIPQDKDTNFIGWVRKHKNETLQKLDNKWKIVKTLF
jgi:plasmid replication initiation protein